MLHFRAEVTPVRTGTERDTDDIEMRTASTMASAGMTQDKRRRIVEQVIQRLDASGMAFETDPQFLSAMNEWIAGTIEMPQLRQRFLDLLQERQSAVRIRYALPPRSPEKGRSTPAGSALLNPDSPEHPVKLRQEDIDTGDSD